MHAISDLEEIGLADEISPVPADDLDSAHPTSVRAAAIRVQFQNLKTQGLKQVDVAKELELPRARFSGIGTESP